VRGGAAAVVGLVAQVACDGYRGVDESKLPAEPVCRAYSVAWGDKIPTAAVTPASLPRPPSSSISARLPFRVLDPVGPVSWARESQHVLQWTTGGLPAGATVTLAQSSGDDRFEVVQTVPAAAGRVVWAVPAGGSDLRRVKITPSWGAPAEVFDVTLTPSQKASYRWVCVTDRTPFTRRDGAGSLVFKDRMWLIGGWNPSEGFPRLTGNDVWSSTDGVDWRMDKPQTFRDASFDGNADWEGRHTAGYAVHGGKMWIVGGDPLQGRYQPDVWSSSDGQRWERAAANAPWGQRALHTTVAFADRLWVIGGQTMPDFVSGAVPYAVYDDVWTSGDGATWTRLPADGPRWQARSAIMQGAVLHGRVWIVGGGSYDNPSSGVPARQYMSDVWSSEDGVRWRREAATTPWSPRQYHSVVAWDGKLWVIAGYSEEGNQAGGFYSSDGKNWYSTATPWGPRHAASVWVYGDSVWLAAGGNVDVWRLERR
jgi:hypothetical protein